MILQTEYDFELPFGCVDEDGTLHKAGKMRMATAADEIYPLREPRVQANPEYLSVAVLARVITKLGPLADEAVTQDVVERLFVQDLTYLQDLYNRINQSEYPQYEGVCPECGKAVKFPINFRQAGQ
ncbi:MAG: phage tail assembly protein [Clostridiales Family XIII bacterium]|jgi:hypothetical protein|nr:phage tail assembly protein [Clostridiales Family XIII bacterium]